MQCARHEVTVQALWHKHAVHELTMCVFTYSCAFTRRNIALKNCEDNSRCTIHVLTETNDIFDTNAPSSCCTAQTGYQYQISFICIGYLGNLTCRHRALFWDGCFRSWCFTRHQEVLSIILVCSCAFYVENSSDDDWRFHGFRSITGCQ